MKIDKIVKRNYEINQEVYDFIFGNLNPDAVPIWKKQNLTIKEAAEYFNVGANKLYELTNDEDCRFVLYVGNKRLIKREKFEAFINADSTYSI